MQSTDDVFQAVAGCIRYVYRNRALALGLSKKEIYSWSLSVAGEGIAVAYKEKSHWDRQKGSFTKFAFLKARMAARAELDSQQRFQKLKSVLEEQPFEELVSRDSLGECLLKDELRGLLGLLNDNQRETLALYYIAGLEVEEISRLTQRRTKAVYALLDRSRERARVLYKELHLGGARASPAKPRRRISQDEPEEAEPVRSHAGAQRQRSYR